MSEAVPNADEQPLKILGFRVGPLEENTYLLGLGGDALLIDPGFTRKAEFDPVLRALDENRWALRAVLLTHAHVDHVAGLPYVLDRWPNLNVHLSGRERGVWRTVEAQAQLFGVPMRRLDLDPLPFPSEEAFQIGEIAIDLLHTPGHSPDHCAFWLKRWGVLISGDVLFRESVGRTDILGGDAEELTRSIHDVVYALPDHTKVLPGHGPETTVGWEKAHNPFVRATS